MMRNTLKLDTTGFDTLIRKLESLGGDVQKAVTDAMTQVGETITEDTIAALADAYLPAGGAYRTGATEESVVQNAPIAWNGSMASMPVGFDFAKPGAGGFLITGTPKMRPDKELHKMYKQKRYMAEIQNDMADVVMDYIRDKMEGKA